MVCRGILLRLRIVSRNNYRENQNIDTVLNNVLSKNRTVYDKMRKITVHPDRAQMTLQ